ncbi:MAG TPA: LLM class flavin-dependent oxidoreductase [Actinoplanes sp.]|nr:LLM class flavin-dependent oxidoreductase [Actinoplanes sp.]
MTPGAVIGYELPDVMLSGRPAALAAGMRAIDAAGVDYLVLPDRPVAAVTAAAWLATRTSRLALVVTASPAYYEPYNLARMVASLDHISAGRAGWQVSTVPDAVQDANHRREGFDPAARRAERAAEYVPVVRSLWDSWEDGAFRHDKTTGQFIDDERIHAVDHAGPELSVRGPFNIIRPPQGHPVVFAADDSPVAAAADVLTGGDPGPGRPDPGKPRLLTVLLFLAPTGAQAAELHARAGTPGNDHRRAVVVGDPGAVTDRLSAWTGNVDGFTVRFGAESQVGLFTELVLPRLRTGAPSGTLTLRQRLGLPRPPSRFARSPATPIATR